MASLSAIREALKATLVDAVTDIHGYANVPEVSNLPAVVVAPRSAEFQVAMARGMDVYMLDLIVLVSRRDDDLAQYDLDEYVTGAGVKSIRQAVWNNRTLGLADTEASVTGWRPDSYGAQFNIGDLDHVGVVLTVRVSTPGTE